jgi:hypothetical protein
MTTDGAIELHDAPFDTAQPSRGGWAIVELLGHRSHAGFVREIQLFGVAMLEIFVPYRDKDGVQFVHVHSGSALYGIHPSTKAYCKDNAPYSADDMSRPQLTAATDQEDHDDDYYEAEDD